MDVEQYGYDVEQYGYLDGVKVWVMKYYPEGNCYSYHNGFNQYGFARNIKL